MLERLNIQNTKSRENKDLFLKWDELITHIIHCNSTASRWIKHSSWQLYT